MSVEACEVLVPEPAIPLHPRGGLAQRAGLETAGTPLCGTAARDETGVLQDLEVAGNRREADLERLGELGHGRLTLGEPRQDGTARGVGERSEDHAEPVSHLTLP